MTQPLDGAIPCVDSHAHLCAADFDHDRDAVIARAWEAGLRHILLISDLTKPESFGAAIKLAERYENIYWAAGIDPHEAASAREEHVDRLAELALHPKFLAVGEIGLDYHYDYPRDAQARVFLRQLELASDLELPVIIHCRDAWDDLRTILGARLPQKPLRTGPPLTMPGAGILHCFTGTAEDAFDLVSLGFYVSFAGNITFKKTERLHGAARLIPVERLLSETDSPYLAPAPYRGRRNEPAWVREVTMELAMLRGLAGEEMGRQLVKNFAGLFRLEDRN